MVHRSAARSVRQLVRQLQRDSRLQRDPGVCRAHCLHRQRLLLRRRSLRDGRSLPSGHRGSTRRANPGCLEPEPRSCRGGGGWESARVCKARQRVEAPPPAAAMPGRMGRLANAALTSALPMPARAGCAGGRIGSSITKRVPAGRAARSESCRRGPRRSPA
jgi:hypothetical protein